VRMILIFVLAGILLAGCGSREALKAAHGACYKELLKAEISGGTAPDDRAAAFLVSCMQQAGYVPVGPSEDLCWDRGRFDGDRLHYCFRQSGPISDLVYSWSH
jgi:hypothetical protein